MQSRLTTLGGFALSVNGTQTQCPATRKARALTAYLVMNCGANSARERLFEIFWPGIDLDRARDSLSTALHSIRRSIRSAGADADEFLIANKSVVKWATSTTLDAREFADLVSRDDLSSNRAALELYRGDFLEGDYDDWAVSERDRLCRLYETALSRVIRSTKDPDAAHAVVVRNPYDEQAYAAIVEAELTAGRRSSAAAWVERCRIAFTEIGEKPSLKFEESFGHVVQVEPPVRNELTLPFAGREPELAALAQAFRKAVQSEGGLTILHGIAGIGKSTLLERASMLAKSNGLRVLTLKFGDEAGLPFGPWKALFTELCCSDFDVFVRTHASNLTAALAEEICSRLTGPSALIADDVQAATSESLDIFVVVVRQLIARRPVIAAVRVEALPSLLDCLNDLPLELLEIGSLDRTDLKWALAHALGSDHPDVLDSLYNRTSGHPMFFAGLLNSLVDNGSLVRVHHRWQLIKRVDANLELPDTVRRFIQTRLRARGESARAVACALALEPTANANDLAEALCFDHATTLDALDDLLSLGIINEPYSGPQFAFKHELIREVAATELNAGRRASLHRGFAARLHANGKRYSSLRLARHLQAAGEPAFAAMAYLKSAEEALELSAHRDAIDRCNAGIREAANLEPTQDCDMLLGRLHQTAARAAISCGFAEEAIERAHQGLAFARSSGDLRETARAALDIAMIDGATFRIAEQKADAALALQSAQQCHDSTLETQALVQQAMAARELGLREEALQNAFTAYHLATASDASKIGLSALEELLRIQATWWLFGEGLKTADIAKGLAALEVPLQQAHFRLARVMLWYALERFDDAKADLTVALRLAAESTDESDSGTIATVNPQPLLQLGCHYMMGKVAAAQEQWSAAIAESNKAATLTNVASLPPYGHALALLRIDSLLMRRNSGDDEALEEIVQTLSEQGEPCGVLGWSDCAQLARARSACRLRSSDAGARLRLALEVLEERANVAPLDADLAFERLAMAAEEVDERIVSQRARARANHYKVVRHTSCKTSLSNRALEAIH